MDTDRPSGFVSDAAIQVAWTYGERLDWIYLDDFAGWVSPAFATWPLILSPAPPGV